MAPGTGIHPDRSSHGTRNPDYKFKTCQSLSGTPGHQSSQGTARTCLGCGNMALIILHVPAGNTIHGTLQTKYNPWKSMFGNQDIRTAAKDEADDVKFSKFFKQTTERIPVLNFNQGISYPSCP
jgi:hypothetical protein